MTNIVFVCHGNICRSVMAEYIFKDMVKKKHLEDKFEIDSVATSREEIGNDIYPPAKRCLYANGVPFDRHSARQITKADWENNDYVIVMEEHNLYNLKRLFPEYPREKVYKLLSFAGSDADICDPWYSDNFEQAYADIVRGCQGLMKFLT